MGTCDAFLYRRLAEELERAARVQPERTALLKIAQYWRDREAAARYAPRPYLRLVVA
jgi:hypothetical protein